MNTEVVVALIGGIALVLAAGVTALPVFIQLKRLRSDNEQQHADGREELKQEIAAAEERIREEVGGLVMRFDSHLEWHATQQA